VIDGLRRVLRNVVHGRELEPDHSSRAGSRQVAQAVPSAEARGLNVSAEFPLGRGFDYQELCDESGSLPRRRFKERNGGLVRVDSPVFA
jgi:hypothetical protein